MPAPDSMLVEIEWESGTWTDVTGWVDWSVGGSTRFGRQSPFSTPSPAMLSVTFDNTDGRFSPLRQVLADGVTTHPYWPNVLPRKRIRLAYVIDGTPYYRFTGYVKGWPPSMPGGDRARVVVTATTRDDQLSRVTMQSAVGYAVKADLPLFYWPLTDPAGSVSAGEASGGPALLVAGSGPAVVFGGDGPGTGDGPGVAFAPDSSSGAGQVLSALVPGVGSAGASLEVWVNIGTDAPPISNNNVVMGLQTDNSGTAGIVDFETPGGVAQLFVKNAGSITGPSIRDGAWHHLVATTSNAASGGTNRFYVDGVLIGTSTGGAWDGTRITVGDLRVDQLSGFIGSAGQAAAYSMVLSADQIAAHYLAGRGYAGELLSDRVARFLGYAGLTSADWDIDTSSVLCGSYAQLGQDVVSACQAMAVTEGGGSVFYVNPAGTMRFTGRGFRVPGDPALTIDNGADLDGQTFTPAFDDTQINNQVQGSRATASGTASTQTVDDAASQATYGLATDSFSSYAQDDADVLGNAQDRLALQRQPGFRLGQVALDLFTATTADLYVAVAGVEIGDRIRVSGLPPTAAPSTELDVLAEGWADTFSDSSYQVVFDSSPADNPARGVFDDATYGRYGAAADCALDGAIDSDDTTLVIACPTGAAFTVDPDAYPLDVQIAAEVLTLTDPPSGSSTPQTFTGVARGARGTTAAAQADGASVQTYPAATYAL